MHRVGRVTPILWDILNIKWALVIVVVNLHGQFDGISNHLGNTPLGVLMNELLEV